MTRSMMSVYGWNVISGRCCQHRKWSANIPAAQHVIHSVPHDVIDGIQCSEEKQCGVIVEYGNTGKRGRIIFKGKCIDILLPLRSYGGSYNMRIVVDKKNFLNVERVRNKDLT